MKDSIRDPCSLACAYSSWGELLVVAAGFPVSPDVNVCMEWFTESTDPCFAISSLDALPVFLCETRNKIQPEKNCPEWSKHQHSPKLHSVSSFPKPRRARRDGPLRMKSLPSRHSAKRTRASTGFHRWPQMATWPHGPKPWASCGPGRRSRTSWRSRQRRDNRRRIWEPSFSSQRYVSMQRPVA